MRKVIGIGETVLDIIFRDDLKSGLLQPPVAAIPGGSVFNAMISLGRCGVPAVMISEAGDDRIGRFVVDFLTENGVDASRVASFPGTRSPLSLAFLDKNNEADYLFYKDHPHDRLDFDYPEICPNDIVIIGSYYAVNPVIRRHVSGLLERARAAEAIIYYDVNYRSAHKGDTVRIGPNLIENLEYADIVRGSREDFENLYRKSDPDAVYKADISFYCRNFICTDGPHPVQLRAANNIRETYPVGAESKPVSTIGAGDNFNAGLIYGLIKYGITREKLAEGLNADQWADLIWSGQRFSENACKDIYNYVSRDFAGRMKLETEALEGDLFAHTEG
ncbi:MAG: carbohydrate kinase [Prevotella sp.]|nr:carbohydrate kinase [Prevotella sp.]